MLAFTLLVCVSGLLVSSTPQNKIQYDLEKAEELFEEYMWQHSRQYAEEIEKQKRFEIFKQNLIYINEKNLNSDVEYGITRFFDMTHEEFGDFLTLKSTSYGVPHCYQAVLNQTTYSAPDSFDWRDKNVVTKVKDQGPCGSCWAFGTIACVESSYAIKHDELVDLSEQQLVDCDTLDNGCYGGCEDFALLYLKQAGRSITEADYPYEAKGDTCRADNKTIKVRVTGCNHVFPRDEEQLKQALFQYGPLSLGIDASSFFDYKKGIHSKCNFIQPNHAILLVGYGTENDVP